MILMQTILWNLKKNHLVVSKNSQHIIIILSHFKKNRIKVMNYIANNKWMLIYKQLFSKP